MRIDELLPGDMLVYKGVAHDGNHKFSLVISIIESATRLDVVFLVEQPRGVLSYSYGRQDVKGASFDEISSKWQVWRNGEVVHG